MFAKFHCVYNNFLGTCTDINTNCVGVAQIHENHGNLYSETFSMVMVLALKLWRLNVASQVHC